MCVSEERFGLGEVMMQDLFGEVHKPKETHIEIYGDEVKPRTNQIGERWAYIGIVLIPIEKKNDLVNALCLPRAEINCHSEIKSRDLDHRPKRQLANAWLDILLSDQETRRIYFNILGINLSNLNYEAFGGSNFQTIYNRFFRTCVKSALNNCFPNCHITVRKVYHDAGDMQAHALFPWHVINRLSSECSDVTFLADTIEFVESDHGKPGGCRESHLIQFIDLIMGLTSQCLDFTSHKESVISVSSRLYGLIERMMHNHRNVNSRYGHYRKYTTSFFPSQNISTVQMFDSIVQATSGFYQERRVLQMEWENYRKTPLFR
jgi:hypothetical protein